MPHDLLHLAIPFARPALINGAAGAIVAAHGRPLSVMGFTVTGGKILAIDVLSDPERLHHLDLTMLEIRPAMVGG
jgi:RNA polymerase sigma-70 factor (ECF subfamily)